MTAKLEVKSQARQKDLVNLIILLLFGAVLGIYLISTSVLISQDGIHYIDRAQRLWFAPIETMKEHPPGYPFLIFIGHKVAGLFYDNSSSFSWAHTAQSVSLLCRLLAIIPLYFIGKLLVGGRRSFWAVLVLLVLPHPAEFGSDVLREWPHLLFLAFGILFLLLGMKYGRWWMFGVVGVFAGFGHMIRPECAQLIVYGVLWLAIGLWRPRPNMERRKAIYALVALLITFTGLVLPYMKMRDVILPEQLEELISSSVEVRVDPVVERPSGNSHVLYMSSSVPSRFVGACVEFSEEISESLMYFFFLASMAGIYHHFRKVSTLSEIERFFVPTFVVSNVAMLFLLYHNYEYISTRHCLPLVAILCFYVPCGLQIFGNWFAARSSKSALKSRKDSQVNFFIMLAIGISICVPKLVTPMRMEKNGYRDVVTWLNENTLSDDIIAAADRRIGFYAERKMVQINNDDEIPAGVNYLIRMLHPEDDVKGLGGSIREEVSIWVDEKEKSKRFVVYKIL